MADVHGHDHAPVTDEQPEGPPGEAEIMNRAMQELLIERNLISADEIRAQIESFESDYPSRGAKLIAKAWNDPDFKEFLLSDGKAACASMGIELETDKLIAVENTPEIHNVLVCTLCSCYPRRLLGHPPTWYKSDNYRKRVVVEPRAVLAEFGTEIAEDVALRVHDSNADMRYVVIPMRPEGTEGWTETELEAIITRDALVGVTLPKVPT
ncbi:MAG: nitrile hydratase subunit alpha [Alphaproteobacteria bacterium]|nr:nitrile hydratase subunit alpha [Alphaproteobacteria bacterium]